MKEMNTFINNNFNSAGFDFNEINSCINGGLQFNYQPFKRIGFTLGFNYFFPFKQSDGITIYHYDQLGYVIGKSGLNVDLMTRAYNFYLEPYYNFYQTEKYRFSAGIGILYSNGFLKLNMENDAEGIYKNEKWRNNSVGFLIDGNFEFIITPSFSVFAGLGYQYNNIANLMEEEGETVNISKDVLSDGTLSLDYSGLNLKVGIILYTKDFKSSK